MTESCGPRLKWAHPIIHIVSFKSDFPEDRTALMFLPRNHGCKRRRAPAATPGPDLSAHAGNGDESRRWRLVWVLLSVTAMFVDIHASIG